VGVAQRAERGDCPGTVMALCLSCAGLTATQRSFQFTLACSRSQKPSVIGGRPRRSIPDATAAVPPEARV